MSIQLILDKISGLAGGFGLIVFLLSALGWFAAGGDVSAILRKKSHQREPNGSHGRKHVELDASRKRPWLAGLSAGLLVLLGLVGLCAVIGIGLLYSSEAWNHSWTSRQRLSVASVVSFSALAILIGFVIGQFARKNGPLNVMK